MESEKKEEVPNPKGKGKRTGKELWKLAKVLVKQETKMNMAQSILRHVRL